MAMHSTTTSMIAIRRAPTPNGLTVGSTPNGNTVEDVQYDYQSLTAGTDYTVADDGSIVLSRRTGMLAYLAGCTQVGCKILAPK